MRTLDFWRHYQSNEEEYWEPRVHVRTPEERLPDAFAPSRRAAHRVLSRGRLRIAAHDGGTGRAGSEGVMSLYDGGMCAETALEA